MTGLCLLFLGSRFCDLEETEFEGIKYSWPELAGGESHTIPCPGAYNPSHLVSRSCDPAGGGWLPANMSLCKNVLETIKEVLDQQVCWSLATTTRSCFCLQVTAGTYSDQVGVIATTLQRTVLEQSEQSDDVLGAVVKFFGAVAAVAEDSNGSIPIQVMEGLVDSLSYLQQWQTSILLENRGTIAR